MLGTQLDHFFDMPNTNISTTTCSSDYCTASIESNFYGKEGGGGREFEVPDGNWTSFDQLLNGDGHTGGEEEHKMEEEEDNDVGIMDFQFLDDVGSSCYYSPFEIAEEMAQPMEQENYGVEPSSMLTEAMKRMKYERNFSASLYAFNGISECLKLKLGSVSILSHDSSDNQDIKKKEEEGVDIQVAVQEQERSQLNSTELGSSSSSSSSFTSSSSSSSSSSSKEGSEWSLWNSLDLPPITMLFSES